MDFALSEEQTAIFDMAEAFGQEHIAPFARQWEVDGTIPKALWRKIGALGFGAIYVPQKHGGSGLSRLDATLIFEALSKSCPSVSAFLSIHNMCTNMLSQHGSAALKAKLLPQALSMESLFSYCLTEPGAGSDAAALTTRAEAKPEGYSLSGSKSFISGGGYSDAYIVMARTGVPGAKGISAFVVDAAQRGLSFGALEDKMGWKAQPTRAVHFDQCDLPPDNLLGTLGHGFTYAMQALDGGRLNIAACSLGAAQAALDATLVYMSERQAFGRAINTFQALQFRLAEFETEMQAARIFLRQAAWKLDTQSPDASQFCAMAKLFVTETASKVADGCLQLHGGYGYLAEYGIEKIVRDLRVHQILEGTNEIMRLIIARELTKT
ncbi:MAG: acyl-CoA dehydrogenase family protein [Rhodobacteraceae bacterium]|nr:acyl-CoA dehydrogenase family protein [Paracoccaceae bacterium]